jgi:hypothetical protein
VSEGERWQLLSEDLVGIRIAQDIFACNVRLMQGVSLYPLLYSLYVNDIEVELINQGCQSYELKKIELVFCLMYADDIVST